MHARMQKNFPGEGRSEGYIHCMYMLSRGNRVQGMFSVFHYVNLRNLNLPETPPLRATHEIRALYECVTRSCIFYNFKTDIDYMCIVPSYIYLSTDNMAKYNTTVTKPWTFQLFQTAMLTIF